VSCKLAWALKSFLQLTQSIKPSKSCRHKTYCFDVFDVWYTTKCDQAHISHFGCIWNMLAENQIQVCCSDWIPWLVKPKLRVVYYKDLNLVIHTNRDDNIKDRGRRTLLLNKVCTCMIHDSPFQYLVFKIYCILLLKRRHIYFTFDLLISPCSWYKYKHAQSHLNAGRMLVFFYHGNSTMHCTLKSVIDCISRIVFVSMSSEQWRWWYAPLYTISVVFTLRQIII